MMMMMMMFVRNVDSYRPFYPDPHPKKAVILMVTEHENREYPMDSAGLWHGYSGFAASTDMY
jgi:hypothetical protein